MKIPILLDEQYLKFNIEKWLMWEPEKAPHAVIIGATGSGKTYFSKLLLGKISLYVKDSEIIVNDAKGDSDFLFLQGCSKNFYKFTECSKGLDTIYTRLLERQQGVDKSRHMLFCFFDEWASYLNFQDKKQAEEDKKKMANLLMMSRSFGIFIIVGLQRGDARYFDNSRDNLNTVIALGNLSAESKEMFFKEYRHEMKPDRSRGTGYMLTNGTDLKAVSVPQVKNVNKLHQTIREAVERNVT